MDICFENDMKDRKVLVTGAYGFIGSHLVQRLLTLGARISIIVKNNRNEWRLMSMINEVDKYILDITDTCAVDSCIKAVKPDYVFHLAAYGVDSAQRSYIPAAQINILGTINIISALRDIGCIKVINLGSCAEYGNQQEPMHEAMCPMPVSIYGSTKTCAVITAHQIAAENSIPIVTLRPFGVFGEGEDRHKIFSHTIMSILENRDVELTSCEQYRDYLYVENLIDGMIAGAQNKALKNEIMNIASGKVYPLKHYIDLIFEYMSTDKTPLYGYVKYRSNEMWTPIADIRKIQKLLNWAPRIRLEDGILKTITWYQQNKKLLSYQG